MKGGIIAGMVDTLVLVYEPEQVDDVVEYIRAHPEARIVALDFWAEQRLKEKDVPFESSKAYLPSETEMDALFEQAQAIAREWYRIPGMSFFEHRGIRLGEALESSVDNYLQYVLYCTHVLRKVFDAHKGIVSVVVPYSRDKGIAYGPLLAFQFRSVVDITEEFSRQYSFTVATIGEPTSPFPSMEFGRPAFHQLSIIALLNAFAAIQPRRSRKLLASEDWTHIKPFIEKMHDTELVLTDKGELRKMSWRSLIRYRVRFLFPAMEAPRGARKEAQQLVQSFQEHWKNARTAVGNLPYMQQSGRSIWPILEKAFDFLVQTYPTKVIIDIEGIAEMLQREHIDTVLLRASVSAQHIFFVTARIAHSFGIPSIEIQHAGAVLDPRSIHSRLEASYVAAFGPLTCSEYAKRYDEHRLRSIGAPRFDPYFSHKHLDTVEREQRLREIGLDPTHPVVLIVVPKEDNRLWLAPWHPSSYDAASLFDTLARTRARLPNVQFIFKFRRSGCTEDHRKYLRRLFPAGGFAISEEDLFSMIQLSDCVMSGMSTALYETIIAEKPLILFPWKPDVYHSPVYGRIGPILKTPKEMFTELSRIVNDPSYREVCLQRQKKFINDYYSFDGHAWERMLQFLLEELDPLP